MHRQPESEEEEESVSSVHRRALTALCVLASAIAVPSAEARTVPAGRPLDWQPCATAPGWQCATASVPKVYGKASSGHFDLAVTRLPAADSAHRVGAIFLNYGGPGAGAVESTQGFDTLTNSPLHDRFDIVAFDPRGTGLSSQAIDCKANQETEGVYSEPFFEPGDDLGAFLRRINGYWAKCKANNPGVLPYTATAN